ncbi:hypothetical protein IFR05_016162 [Cadophora sp. M221]|nr:hypothetical protein IFR05_016162 [Cadophora sp. M221]
MANQSTAQEDLLNNYRVPKGIASYYADLSQGNTNQEDHSICCPNNLDDAVTTKPRSKTVEPSNIAVYFADSSQATIDPSKSSIIPILEQENAKLRDQLELCMESTKYWQIQTESYQARKHGWVGLFRRLHKETMMEVEKFDEGFTKLFGRINSVEKNQKAALKNIKAIAARLERLLNPEESGVEGSGAPPLPVESVEFVTRMYKENITELRDYAEPFFRDARKVDEDDDEERIDYSQDATAAVKKTILNAIINKDISSQLESDLEALRTSILGFFGKHDIKPLKQINHARIIEDDFTETVSAIKVRLALYRGDYDMMMSQLIDEHQADILENVRKGIRKLVDAKIDIDGK